MAWPNKRKDQRQVACTCEAGQSCRAISASGVALLPWVAARH
jgi:hypothetical protein